MQCVVMDVFKWDLWVTPVTQTLPSVLAAEIYTVTLRCELL